MNETALWMMSINAFLAVIVLLSLLGGILKAITALFPYVETPTVSTNPARSPTTASTERVADAAMDPAVLTAIQTAVQRAYPGAEVREVRHRTERAS